MKTEGQLIKSALGQKWSNLSDKTKCRFEADPSNEAPKHYSGNMSEVSCSKVGMLLAYIARFVGGPLIPYSGRNVPIDVIVFKKPNDPAIYKKRTYYFQNRKPFTVQSKMLVNESGEFYEFAGFGLGMKMELNAKNDMLFFEGRKYCLKIGTLSITIPLFLSPGKAFIQHSDYGDDAFQVHIEMQHPWFGLMYVQDGIFRDQA